MSEGGLITLFLLFRGSGAFSSSSYLTSLLPLFSPPELLLSSLDSSLPLLLGTTSLPAELVSNSLPLSSEEEEEEESDPESDEEVSSLLSGGVAGAGLREFFTFPICVLRWCRRPFDFYWIVGRPKISVMLANVVFTDEKLRNRG